MAEDVYVATETFAVDLDDGTPVVVHRDQTHVRSGDELLRRFPQFFRVMGAAPEVEQATAAPAEKRVGKRPVKKDE